MRGTILGVLLVGVLAVAAAGFAGGRLTKTTSTVTELQTTTQTLISTSTTQIPLGHIGDSSCATYVSGQDAQVILYGGLPDACSTWVARNSGNGTLWVVGTNPAGLGAPVCTLEDGPEGIAVLDSGGQAIGQNVCSNLVESGWVETQALQGR